MQRSSRAVSVSAFLLASALGAGVASAGPVFMQLEGVDVPGGSGEIEIQSFHWGPRQSTSVDGSRTRTGNQIMMDDKDGGQKLQPAGGGGGGHGTGKVNVHDISISRYAAGPASSDMTMKGSKIGENAPRGTGANQMSMDDTAGKEKARRRTRTVGGNETITIGGGRTESDPDLPIITGSVPNASASRRQHGAVTISKEWDTATPQLAKPQDKGSVWIRVASPWTACRAGTRYPAIELGDGKANYRLSDVVVTRCDAGGASLDYAKIKVRGWDPEKKEE